MSSFRYPNINTASISNVYDQLPSWIDNYSDHYRNNAYIKNSQPLSEEAVNRLINNKLIPIQDQLVQLVQLQAQIAQFINQNVELQYFKKKNLQIEELLEKMLILLEKTANKEDKMVKECIRSAEKLLEEEEEESVYDKYL